MEVCSDGFWAVGAGSARKQREVKEAGLTSSLSDDQFNLGQFQDIDPESGETQTQHSTIMERLLWGNLHTAFLGIGTLLTTISVILLLFGMRNSLQGIIR